MKYLKKERKKSGIEYVCYIALYNPFLCMYIYRATLNFKEENTRVLFC